MKENKPVSNSVQELQYQLDQANKEIAILKEAQLERDEYLAQGCFNALKWRVLHPKENPIAELENVTTYSTPSISNRVSSSKDEVEELKKRIERMKSVFASQTNRFRDAVYLYYYYIMSSYQLTGWNIELNPIESKLRLRSRYASDRDDFIELVWYVIHFMINNRSGTDQFKLLDTSFVNSLDANLFTFLTISNSFPAFLSAVTQDLFGKQTVLGPPA